MRNAALLVPDGRTIRYPGPILREDREGAIAGPCESDATAMKTVFRGPSSGAYLEG